MALGISEGLSLADTGFSGRVDSVSDYETPTPPNLSQTLEWLLDAINVASATDLAVCPSSIEAVIKAAVHENAIDGEALCGVADEAELAEVLRLQTVDLGDGEAQGGLVGTLWQKVKYLQRVGQQAPWGFPTILPKATDSAVTFVVLGDTGAGKSTVLNALLGECSLLPTNGMRACTAAIVELSYNYAPAQLDRPYEGTVEFLSPEEWAAERARLYDALRQPDGSIMRSLPAEGSPAHVAFCKLRSVYGSVVEPEEVDELARPLPSTVSEVAAWLRRECGEKPAEMAVKHGVDGGTLLLRSEADLVDLLSLADAGSKRTLVEMKARMAAPSCSARRVSETLGSTVRVSHLTAHDLRLAVEAYVDSSNTTTDGALWPLVKSVKLKGPWECLTGGAVLVDAPGVQDDNSARDAVVRSYLRSAHAVWLVSNIRRAVNDKTVKDYLTLELKQDLVRNGLLGELAFVATQTDILEASEIADNLGLPVGTGKTECARARNAFTKHRIVADFYTGVETEHNPQAAAQRKSCCCRDSSAVAEGGANGTGATESAAAVYGLSPYPCLPPLEDEPLYGGCEATRSHWGEWRALPVPNNPSVCVYRWTDDAGCVRGTAGCLPPPSGDAWARDSTHAALVREPTAPGFRLPVITASAVDFQKLMGIRRDDGAPDTFRDVVDTEVLALRQLVHTTVAARRVMCAKLEYSRDCFQTEALSRRMGAVPPAVASRMSELSETDIATRIQVFEEALEKAEARRVGRVLLDYYEARIAAIEEEEEEDEDADCVGDTNGRQVSEAEEEGGDALALGPLSLVFPCPRWRCTQHLDFSMNFDAWSALQQQEGWSPRAKGIFDMLPFLSMGKRRTYIELGLKEREEAEKVVQAVCDMDGVKGGLKISFCPGGLKLAPVPGRCGWENKNGEGKCGKCGNERHPSCVAIFSHRLDRPADHKDELQMAVEVFRFLESKSFSQVTFSSVEACVASKGISMVGRKQMLKQLVDVFKNRLAAGFSGMPVQLYADKAMAIVFGGAGEGCRGRILTNNDEEEQDVISLLDGNEPEMQACGKRPHSSVGACDELLADKKCATSVDPELVSPCVSPLASDYDEFTIDSDGAIVID